MPIGSCDNCDRKDVPVAHYETPHGDTTQCFICTADPWEKNPDPDPLRRIGGQVSGNRNQAHSQGLRMNAPHATRVLLEQSAQAQIIEDVSQIVRVAPFVARCPIRMFTPGLASELANAVDLLACKVADLREAEGADR